MRWFRTYVRELHDGLRAARKALASRNPVPQDFLRDLRPRLHQLRQRFDWRYKVILLVGGASLVAFLLGPRWIISRHADDLSFEALQRGTAIVKTLAMANQQALALKQDMFYDVESALDENGVLDAVLADAQGLVVAPISRAGTKIAIPPEPRLGLTKQGDGIYKLSFPMFTWVVTEEEARKKHIGTAFLIFSTRRVLEQLSATRFEYFKFLAFVAIVMGAAIYLMLRITERPMEEMGERLQDCLKGEADGLEVPHDFHLLARVAEGMNQIMDGQRVETRQAGVGEKAPSDSKAAGEIAGGITKEELERLLSEGLGQVTGDSLLLLNRENQVVFANDEAMAFFRRDGKSILGAHLLEIAGTLPQAPLLIELADAALSNPGCVQKRHLNGTNSGLSRMGTIAVEVGGQVDFYLLTLTKNHIKGDDHAVDG